MDTATDTAAAAADGDAAVDTVRCVTVGRSDASCPGAQIYTMKTLEIDTRNKRAGPPYIADITVSSLFAVNESFFLRYYYAPLAAATVFDIYQINQPQPPPPPSVTGATTTTPIHHKLWGHVGWAASPGPSYCEVVNTFMEVSKSVLWVFAVTDEIGYGTWSSSPYPRPALSAFRLGPTRDPGRYTVARYPLRLTEPGACNTHWQPLLLGSNLPAVAFARVADWGSGRVRSPYVRSIDLFAIRLDGSGGRSGGGGDPLMGLEPWLTISCTPVALLYDTSLPSILVYDGRVIVLSASDSPIVNTALLPVGCPLTLVNAVGRWGSKRLVAVWVGGTKVLYLACGDEHLRTGVAEIVGDRGDDDDEARPRYNNRCRTTTTTTIPCPSDTFRQTAESFDDEMTHQPPIRLVSAIVMCSRRTAAAPLDMFAPRPHLCGFADFRDTAAGEEDFFIV